MSSGLWNKVGITWSILLHGQPFLGRGKGHNGRTAVIRALHRCNSVRRCWSVLHPPLSPRLQLMMELGKHSGAVQVVQLTDGLNRCPSFCHDVFDAPGKE